MSTRFRLGIIIPILSSFREAIICLSRIRTKHIWTPYIGPQWEENKAISNVWNTFGSEAFDDGCDFVLILNDDAWVYPQTVDNLVEEISKTESLLVSGVNCEVDGEYKNWKDKKVNLDFSCFVIRPETFEKIGLFDENFYPAYYEDNDYHYRIIELGFSELAYGITKAPFYHQGKGSTTFNREQERLNLHSRSSANKEYYIRKWGGVPGKERFKTPFNNGGSVKEWQIA